MAERRRGDAPRKVVSGSHDLDGGPRGETREGPEGRRAPPPGVHHRGEREQEAARLGGPREGVAQSADLGLAIGEKDRWRKGYGTEVVQLLLIEAFEQLNLHRVAWWTFAENAASLGLARK